MRHAYDGLADEVSEETGLRCEDKSLAIQSQKEDADINTIVRRFGVTGELPVSQRVPLQVDVDELLDYRQCMDFVRMADASFASLPAEVRNKFENNAAAFVAFASDRENLPQLREWGLAAPVPAEPAAPGAPGAPESP